MYWYPSILALLLRLSLSFGRINGLKRPNFVLILSLCSQLADFLLASL